MNSQGFDPTRGRWIPWVFVGGMGLVIGVNAILVWFALTTFTGVTTPRAYDRGRTYNDVLAEAPDRTRLAGSRPCASPRRCSKSRPGTRRVPRSAVR